MKLHFIFFLITTKFFCTALSAQTNADEVYFSNGPVIQKDKKVDEKPMTIGQDETGCYYLFKHFANDSKNAKPIFIIDHVNKKLELDITKTIKREDYPNLDFCTMLNGNLYFFNSTRDKNFDFTISYQRVNKTTLTEEQDQKVVSTGHDARRNDLYGPDFFDYRISADESHLLIFNTNYKSESANPRKGDTATYLHLAIFNSAMEKLWEQEVVIPIKPDYFDLKQLKIDNDGRVYLITLLRSPNRYQCYRFSNDANENISMPVLITGKRIVDFQCANKLNGDIILAGFYTDSIPYDRSQGTFYFLVDSKTHEIKNQTSTPFEISFTDNFQPSLTHNAGGQTRDQSRFKPGVPNLHLKDLLINEDGSLSMIAEQYAIMDIGMGPPAHNVSSLFSNFNTYASAADEVYYYDIIAIGFDNAGKQIWKARIPKHQYSSTAAGIYFSFSWISKDKNLYFFYNDNSENYPIAKSENERKEYSNPATGIVIMTKLDSTGHFTSKKVNVAPGNNLAILPKESKKSGQNEMYIASCGVGFYEFSKLEIR